MVKNVHILNEQSSQLNRFLAEIRDQEIQKDPLRFRANIERIGYILAYELSKSLPSEAHKIQTPLGVAEETYAANPLVLATVLRAGLPLHSAFLSFFDRAENAFVSAFRKEGADGDIEIEVGYNASPDLTGKTLVVVDPMLATGKSGVAALEALLQNGKPGHVHFVSIIGSREGVAYLSKHAPCPITIWSAAVDDVLNEKKYIVPGLGDAGDLAYGVKL